MKKILSLILIFISLNSLAQFPNNPTQANTSTNNQFLGAATFQKGMLAGSFADTTACNLVSYIKTVPHILIHTADVDAYWFRNAAATAWIQLLPSGGSGGLQSWLTSGNVSVFGDARGNAKIGTLSNNGMYWVTNNQTRLYMPKSGLGVQTGTTLGIGYDPSDSNRLTLFSGGSVANEWHITGNSGTTVGTNFLGNTDDKSLMFKINNLQSGLLENNGDTYFGYRAGISRTITLGVNNGFGAESLQGVTDGHDNTSIGTSSQLSNVHGIANTSLGNFSLTATTGNANIGIGFYGGAYNTSGSNQVFINSIDRTNYAGDMGQSPIYIVQNASLASQRTSINGEFTLNNATKSNGYILQSDASGNSTWVNPIFLQ